ncbi:hypothetical protein JTE90_004369 [Oedothorax gibbosus]|uniref:Glycosyl transferase CAP10 domain-containing protein n=1 Tax=Oedothorax gibbosus TaxID=931172 RepID=A0AAV6VMG2_9ARAC|nr:hypothetical protein JTE90_004369 [Oedothorax gibbosus]
MHFAHCFLLYYKIIYFIVSLFLPFIFCQESNYTASISLKNCKVYGPGLQANFTVPVRYFFIELVDTEHKSFSSSPQSLSIQVTGLREKCRIWYQLLHVKEGTFIARYRLYETCLGVQIDIVYEDQNVAQAPYLIKGLMFHEQCYCPKPMTEWLSALNCPATYPQIERDLDTFPSVNMKESLQDAFQRFNNPGSFSICHYAVVSNKVYRKCLGQYVGFSMFMDEILLSLTRKMYLPDFELLSNLGDWPLEQRKPSEKPIPIFSWCGSQSTQDIVMPTYDITEATLEMMGRVMVDMLSVMGNSGPSWEEKIQMSFWRGRDSRQERLDLVKLGREYPHLINASLTNFFFFKNAEVEYGPKSDYISFFDFFKYRYQINVDGTVAAYRLPYLLAGRSLVLKQESEYYEHFYNDIQPMVHYVPFDRDLSNLVEKLQWAVDHDSEAKVIAENAQKYALENLMPKDILCYYAVLFKEYSKRLTQKTEILENMDHVKQPVQKNCLCPNQEEEANPPHVNSKEEL